ncbi:MAG: hypothetical protein V1733_11380 [bacterium]
MAINGDIWQSLHSTLTSSTKIQHLFPAPGCQSGQVFWLFATTLTNLTLAGGSRSAHCSRVLTV